MNDLDESEARKIYKRIELKQNNLKIYLPEINFLQFIEELDTFQQLIEGIDTAGQTTQVQLPLARARFFSLQTNYKRLLATLQENSRNIEKYSDESLLREFFGAICESKLFITKSSRNFCTQISLSTNYIYNIRIILKIYDLLHDFRTDVNTVRRNFDNLRKSSHKRKIKEILAGLYTRALTSCNLKYNKIASLFPKFAKLPVYQLKCKVFKAAQMAEPEETGKNKPDERENNKNADKFLTEPKSNPIEEQKSELDENPGLDKNEVEEVFKVVTEFSEKKIEDEPNPAEQEPSVVVESMAAISEPKEISVVEVPAQNEIKEPEDFNKIQSAQFVEMQPTNSKSPVRLSSITSVAELKSELQKHKHAIDETLTEIHSLEQKLKELNMDISNRQYNVKKQLNELEAQKRAITENMNLSEDERTKEVQDLSVQIGQLTAVNEETLRDLETQKNKIKNLSLVLARKLNALKQFLIEKKREHIENLEKAEQEATDDAEKEKLQKTNNIILELYVSELKIFSRLDKTDEFEVDDLGVFFIDDHNKRTYLTSVGDEHFRRIGENSQKAASTKSQSNECISKESMTSSCHTSSSCQQKSTVEKSNSSTSSEENKEPLLLDSENYIKTTLGKPLRQALASITVYQPSDPINYLANYLLQYRYNQLRNIQRQKDFENLLIERENYAKNQLHDKQINNCDPCRLPPRKH